MKKKKVKKLKRLLTKRREVTVALDELALLCLNVDYVVDGDVREMIENLSVEMQDEFGFDTHLFRQELKLARL